jgi:hypothetical protein
MFSKSKPVYQIFENEIHCLMTQTVVALDTEILLCKYENSDAIETMNSKYSAIRWLSSCQMLQHRIR